jgi:hypothetical protein
VTNSNDGKQSKDKSFITQQIQDINDLLVWLNEGKEKFISSKLQDKDKDNSNNINNNNNNNINNNNININNNNNTNTNNNNNIINNNNNRSNSNENSICTIDENLEDSFDDVTTSEATIEVDSIYDKFIFDMPEAIQPSLLSPLITMHRYQLQGLYWMQNREVEMNNNIEHTNKANKKSRITNNDLILPYEVHLSTFVYISIYLTIYSLTVRAW